MRYRDRDTLISNAMSSIDSLSNAKNAMAVYIREFGYCGYTGKYWKEESLNCHECADNNDCERYQILTKWG